MVWVEDNCYDDGRPFYAPLEVNSSGLTTFSYRRGLTYKAIKTVPLSELRLRNADRGRRTEEGG